MGRSCSRWRSEAGERAGPGAPVWSGRSNTVQPFQLNLNCLKYEILKCMVGVGETKAGSLPRIRIHPEQIVEMDRQDCLSNNRDLITISGSLDEGKERAGSQVSLVTDVKTVIDKERGWLHRSLHCQSLRVGRAGAEGAAGVVPH